MPQLINMYKAPTASVCSGYVARVYLDHDILVVTLESKNKSVVLKREHDAGIATFVDKCANLETRGWVRLPVKYRIMISCGGIGDISGEGGFESYGAARRRGQQIIDEFNNNTDDYGPEDLPLTFRVEAYFVEEKTV